MMRNYYDYETGLYDHPDPEDSMSRVYLKLLAKHILVQEYGLSCDNVAVGFLIDVVDEVFARWASHSDNFYYEDDGGESLVSESRVVEACSGGLSSEAFADWSKIAREVSRDDEVYTVYSGDGLVVGVDGLGVSVWVVSVVDAVLGRIVEILDGFGRDSEAGGVGVVWRLNGLLGAR